MEYKAPAAEPVTPAPAAAAPAPAKSEPGRIRLFDRYRRLTSGGKADEAPALPPTQAKAAPAKPERQMGLNISVGPQDRPVSSQSEDELEIPAFLRRQAN